MDRIFILLDWYYEGDSYLINSFEGAFLTKQDALDKIETYKNIPEFITFINYKTGYTSEVFIEDYEPVEYGGYGSKNKVEIREIIFEKNG